MSRPKNPDNNYTFVDAVTGESIHTNPKQFNELMARYGITRDELLKSYVGQKGRNQLAAEKHTVESAIQKYGLHPNVANALKALRAPVVKTPRAPKTVEVSTETVEVPADAVTEPIVEASAEQESPAVEETVTADASAGVLEEA